MKNKKQILKLIDTLKKSDSVFIQPHNFPDHDAIASAFGLQHLLINFNVHADICYDGIIERHNLHQMIKDLGIRVYSQDKAKLRKDSLIVIVDGCKYNKNVTDLFGIEIAVIDHHQVESPDDVEYSDIRSNYGSCSTIIAEYFTELNIKIPKSAATAMLIGLNIDTASLKRGVSHQDIIAFEKLWNEADIDYVNRIMMNNLSVNDMPYFKKSIENLMIEKNFGFIFLDQGCPKNLMGITCDFFLGLEELDFIVIAAKTEKGINFSTRSELKKWNAAIILNQALSGIGNGGGHDNMAGGFMPDSCISSDELFKRFKQALF